MVGSANVTFNGLHNNIEVSTLVHLDPADLDDVRFIHACLESVDELPKRFPKHVFEIKTVGAADDLFQQGQLSNKELIVAKPSTSVVRKGKRDHLLSPLSYRDTRRLKEENAFGLLGKPQQKN